MGLFINQSGKRSELQTKIIADLQEKTRSMEEIIHENEEAESPMLDNQHQTRTAGVIIGALIIVTIVAIVFIASRS